MRSSILATLGMLAWAGAALADDPVPIGDLLADPDAYHFRLVTLHGTVSGVTPLAPYSPTPDTACYGAYTFLLGDESGSVDVNVLGICGKPLVRAPEVRDGERIRLTAQVLSPNRMPSTKKGEEKKLRVIANTIAHGAPEDGAAEKTEEAPGTDEGKNQPAN